MSQTPVIITPGTGGASIAAELVSGTSFQQIEVYGGGGSSVLSINPDGSIKASIIGTPTFSISGNASISGTVGASIVGQLPAGNAILGAVAASISGVVNVSGSVVGFQGGTQITSISGVVISSISGTAGASVIGTVPVTQSGAWTTSVVGGPVTLYAPTTSLVSGVTSVITGTASVTVLVGAPGGQRNYITHILATNAAATATFVNIFDGGNVVYSGYAAASGGGFSATLPAPLRQSSAQGALCVSTPTQASVVVAVSGYTAT